jgi:outer membrane protein assembly factor BamB
MTINSIPSAVPGDGVVYVMAGYGDSIAYAISLEARGNLENGSNKIIWKYNKGTPYVPSPLLAEGRLYFTLANNPLLTILDAKTGKALVDRARLPGQNSFYGSPVAAAGRVYLADRDGTTLVLKQGDNFEILASNILEDRFDATPVPVGRQLFLRGEKFLYCIENQ